MKIQFDPNLDFQKQAIDAVCGIFEGQETCQTNFTVAPLQYTPQHNLPSTDNNLGVGNQLQLDSESILANIRRIQMQNGLATSGALESMDFTVEMETGTGKTYVYLRSIFELNRLYGFTKFIIVVPSIAIKEGVAKTLEITTGHFKQLYDNVIFDTFVYDSSKLSQVRNFATSPDIQIMVINIDAFRKSFDDPEEENKANIIHRFHDRMMGSKPIKFIQDTNPVVIIDEPQSVDTTERSREAIDSLKPLCTLRYSATHVEEHHMLYKLDAVDAYQRKLVKQIEVAGFEFKDDHNSAYIKLLSVNNRETPITATIEIDRRVSGGVIKRKQVTVKKNSNLFETKYSNGRDVYQGYIIDDIYCEKGGEYISFTSQPDVIKLRHSIGGIDHDEIKRLQIRKTIEEHLDKEMRLRPKGIKVLSLFFVDKVANYRYYDEDGNVCKGKYADMFEEEYDKAIRKPKYKSLFTGVDLNSITADVHNGYFAIDNNRRDTSGNEILKDTRGKSQADEDVYQLIMKDKEKLLSFESKLKFVFSHSALREGWDNPNVFQICTLNETGSVIKKRQEIGRGLRLCVNQEGERVHGFEVNTLTVMANESYEKYAQQLQSEIEQDTGTKFGVIEVHSFSNILVSTDGYESEYLGDENSKNIWEFMKAKGYIDSNGKILDSLKTALQEDGLELPYKFGEYKDPITKRLKRVSGSLNVRNRDAKQKVTLNKAVFLSPEFKELWDRIKLKTTFRVSFDTEQLVKKCVDAIESNLQVGKPRAIYRKAKAEIDHAGVQAKQIKESVSVYEQENFALPDIITFLQDETNLTRRTIVEIINASGRLELFGKNPEKFIEQVTIIIQNQMRLSIVDGIKYQKVGDTHFYGQNLFRDNELFGYLHENMLASKKSAFNHVVYDSDVEEEFAKALEISDDVKLYTKLPSWFQIDTPLGNYNPDWAVLIEADGQDKLYFVVETKGSRFIDSLRPTEKAKIDCGKEHFKALSQDVEFAMCKDYDGFSEMYVQNKMRTRK